MVHIASVVKQPKKKSNKHNDPAAPISHFFFPCHEEAYDELVINFALSSRYEQHILIDVSKQFVASCR